MGTYLMLVNTPYKGIQAGVSGEGVQVVRIHYSADPAKDPSTEAGQIWLKRELQGYRGMEDPRWRKEMEIDFDAHGGQLLFPYLLANEKTLFVPPAKIEGMRLCAGLDYGTRNPSAFEVLSVDYDGNIQVIWEYYEEPKHSNETDDQFRARKGYKCLAEAIKNCPYFSRKLTIYADPSLWNRTQEAADAKGLMSVADLFVKEGVILSRGQRGRDFACYEKLDSNVWEDPEKPMFTIMKNCNWLWWEMQRLRFADFSATVMANKNLQEKIVDKDNHAWDALKYAIMTIPQFTQKPAKRISSHDQRINALEKGKTTPFEDYAKGQLKHSILSQSGYDWGEKDEYDDGGLYDTV
jgi:hypothetical protein